MTGGLGLDLISELESGSIMHNNQSLNAGANYNPTHSTREMFSPGDIDNNASFTSGNNKSMKKRTTYNDSINSNTDIEKIKEPEPEPEPEPEQQSNSKL